MQVYIRSAFYAVRVTTMSCHGRSNKLVGLLLQIGGGKREKNQDI